MILFTSGFPYAGKTEFAKRLCQRLDQQHLIHINPKDLYPEDFDALSEEEQQATGIVAWEMAFEKTDKCIVKLPNKVLIILDTCCSSAYQMTQLFMDAKIREHDIYLIYVNASLEKRTELAAGKNISKFEGKYASNFQQSLPELKHMSDHFLVINNNGSLSELDENISPLAAKIIESRKN